jgi:hypothetical protein
VNSVVVVSRAEAIAGDRGDHSISGVDLTDDVVEGVGDI